MRKSSKALLVGVALGSAVVAFPHSSRAASSAVEPTGGLSLFAISKSQNRNQVHYAIRLDADCAPIGGAPVEVFWRMFEKGDAVMEPLTSREVSSFGIRSQTVVRRGEHGGSVHMLLNGFPDRPIDVEAVQKAGACQATSTMPIDGKPALLIDVYAKMKWPFGVDYVQLSGWSLDGSHVVRERMNP
jgi:hypothetical protein